MAFSVFVSELVPVVVVLASILGIGLFRCCIFMSLRQRLYHLYRKSNTQKLFCNHANPAILWLTYCPVQPVYWHVIPSS